MIRGVGETLRDIGEFGLIQRLLARLPKTSSRVIAGPGDDAAVTESPPAGSVLVSTTDLLVEGVDFTAAFPAQSIGWKAIAVNLSDLAAMGATPRSVLVGFAAPASTEIAWVEALYDGIAAICREHGVDVIGGDVSGVAAGGITISVTAFGEAKADRVVLRSGARAGDSLCVTGTLGDAAAGLERLLGGIATGTEDPLARRQLEPTPRVRAAIALGDANIVRAMIDVSDGLLADLGHLLDRSRVGARIETAKIPLSPALAALGAPALRHALAGGEDFELLFAVAPADESHARALCEAHGTALTTIGRCTTNPGTMLVRPDGTELPPPPRGGWEHFDRL